MNGIRLAIVGASVRAAARSAARGGCDCLALDMFADADLADLCPVIRIERFDERLVGLLAEADVNAWIYAGGMENHPRLVSWLAEVRPLIGCDDSVLAKVRDPWWLSETLTSAGHAFPEIAAELPVDTATDWLVKERTSCGGLGVRRLRSDETALPEDPVRYYQRYRTGVPVSAMFLATGGECHLLATFEQLIGLPWTGAPAEFMFCGAVGPVGFGERVGAELGRIGRSLTREAGIEGLFGIDAILSGAQLTVLEVNPRYTASMELWERATRLSAIGMWLAQDRANGDEQPIDPERRHFDWPPTKPDDIFGKAIVYAEHPLEIGARFDSLVLEWNNAGLHHVVDVPRRGELIGQGQPVCTIIVRGSDREEVLLQLHEAAATLSASLR